MKTGIGLPVFPGVAIGPAVVYRKSERVLPVSSGDPALEQAKFNDALEVARTQLTALYEKAKVELGEDPSREGVYTFSFSFFPSRPLGLISSMTVSTR